MNILIFPWAKAMRNGMKHPKNYPWWPELIKLLEAHGHNITQAGLDNEEQLVENFQKNLSINDLTTLIKAHDTWIGVDSFAQHLCWDIGVKGFVIFGQSDPLIFGHKENINILKDRKYLRQHQFWMWEQAEFIEEAFLPPKEVIKIIHANFN